MDQDATWYGDRPRPNDIVTQFPPKWVQQQGFVEGVTSPIQAICRGSAINYPSVVRAEPRHKLIFFHY